MNKTAFLVLGAIALLGLVCIRAICTCEPESAWHEDGPGQWSTLRKEGGTFFAISEPGKAPLYRIETECPPSEVGETVEIVQWRAGARTGEYITCSKEFHTVEISSSILEEMDSLPQRARALFKKNWEQSPSSPNGEVLYAQGFSHP